LVFTISANWQLRTLAKSIGQTKSDKAGRAIVADIILTQMLRCRDGDKCKKKMSYLTFVSITATQQSLKFFIC
jgi:hypothetical protein